MQRMCCPLLVKVENFTVSHLHAKTVIGSVCREVVAQQMLCMMMLRANIGFVEDTILNVEVNCTQSPALTLHSWQRTINWTRALKKA